ncbi:MAG: hypothetical protein ACSLE1_01950 [Sphingobium sp.]
MTFWKFLDKLLDRMPGWGSERQWVTTGMFALTALMLLMARENEKLWEQKLFEVAFQAVVLTGLLNLILAFHFSANKGDEAKVENTGKMADAMRAVAENNAVPTGLPGDPVSVKEER